MEQIIQTISSFSLQIMLVFGACFFLCLVAVVHTLYTHRKGEKDATFIANAQNETLSAWRLFALQEGLVNAYPSSVFVDVQDLPGGGWQIKRSVVVVIQGFKEVSYQWNRRADGVIDFIELEEYGEDERERDAEAW